MSQNLKIGVSSINRFLCKRKRKIKRKKTMKKMILEKNEKLLMDLKFHLGMTIHSIQPVCHAKQNSHQLFGDIIAEIVER
jgi:hypothetical protein